MDVEFDFAQDLKPFLDQCRTASLATVDEGGGPHAANVQYVADKQLRLYFVSNPESAHSRHIAAGSKVAVTIYAHNDRPDQIRGVQIHGEAEALESAEARNGAWELYTSKYAFVQAYPMRKVVEAQQFYRVTPRWIRWIDNRRGFGWKVETAWGEVGAER